jgi:hypothetical protein
MRPVPNALYGAMGYAYRAVVTVLFSSWGGDGFEAVVKGEKEFSHNGG